MKKQQQTYAKQLEEGIAEMEATVERLREEIRCLIKERNELIESNISTKKEEVLPF